MFERELAQSTEDLERPAFKAMYSDGQAPLHLGPELGDSHSHVLSHPLSGGIIVPTHSGA
jgi:hypothetical protein